ncbi:MAG: oligosaccharide repeat unit polymerase [Desulfobacteraceae bacterium]|nr:oligosaccharide repeat unit polymerase [Desulfobacteraceae bacterium]
MQPGNYKKIAPVLLILAMVGIIPLIFISFQKLTLFLVVIIMIIWIIYLFNRVLPSNFVDRIFSPTGMLLTCIILVYFPRMLFHVFLFETRASPFSNYMSYNEFMMQTFVALGILLGSLIMFWAGFVLPGVKTSMPRNNFNFKLSSRTFKWYFWILIALGCLGILKFVHNTGMQYFLIILSPGKRILHNLGHGYLEILLRLIPFAMILLYWKKCLEGKQGLTWLALLGIATFFSMGILGQRSRLFYPFLSVIVIHHYLVRKISVKTLFTWGTIILAGTTAFLMYRQLSAGYDMADIRNIRKAYSEKARNLYGSSEGFFHLITNTFRTYDSYFLVVNDDSMLLGGSSYIDVFKQMIPSALWKDKSRRMKTVGKTASDVYMPWIRAGVPPTLLGELYMNFSLIGTFAVMFFLGLVFSFLQKLYRKRYQDPWAVLVLAIFFPNIFNFVWSFALGWFHVMVKDFLTLLLTFLVFRNSYSLGTDETETPEPYESGMPIVVI